MKITDLLLGEHGVFYAMFDHIEERAAEAAMEEIQVQTSLLTSALASHAHLEDDALFKEMEPHIGADGPLSVMRMEHDEIESTLVKILQIDGARVEARDDARDMVLHAITVARSHFSKEENILFPMAEQILGEETLRRLTSKWEALRMAGVAASGHCSRGGM